jgi:hypothetical protein
MGRIKGYETPPDLNKPTTYQQRATDAKRDFEVKLAAIRADTTRTAEAKKQRIAAALAPALDIVHTAKRDELTNYKTAMTRLEKDLFGLPANQTTTDVVSYRDAQDRADTLTLDDVGVRAATDLLERADLSGDTHLTRAIFTRAMRLGWTKVTDAYLDRHPDQRAAVDQYRELRRYDPTTSMMAFYSYKFPAPQELGGAEMSAEWAQEIADRPLEAPTDRTEYGFRTLIDEPAGFNPQRHRPQPR